MICIVSVGSEYRSRLVGLKCDGWRQLDKLQENVSKHTRTLEELNGEFRFNGFPWEQIVSHHKTK